ncbi:MAG: hypothetical protein HYZ79_00455 [Candidatus Melainabacteria bacterium]|nr:hypothetical protein [Candidatus Melainabacteria bacterium]
MKIPLVSSIGKLFSYFSVSRKDPIRLVTIPDKVDFSFLETVAIEEEDLIPMGEVVLFDYSDFSDLTPVSEDDVLDWLELDDIESENAGRHTLEPPTVDKELKILRDSGVPEDLLPACGLAIAIYKDNKNTEIVNKAISEFQQLGELELSDDEKDLYEELLAQYSMQEDDFFKGEFTSNYVELIKKNPSKKDWREYKRFIAYHRERNLPISELTGSFKLCLDVELPEREKTFLYDVVIPHLKDHNYELSNIKNSVAYLSDSKLDDNQWKNYEKLVRYKIKQCAMIDELTYSFAYLIRTKPNQKQCDIVNKAINYSINNGFGLHDMLTDFAEFVREDPSDYQHQLFLEMLDVIQAHEKKKSLHLYTKGFVDLVKAKASPLLLETYKTTACTTLHTDSDTNNLINWLKYCTQRLVFIRYPEAVLRSHNEAIKKSILVTPHQTVRSLCELTSHSAIYTMLRSDSVGERSKALQTYTQITTNDHLPYPLFLGKNKPNPEAGRVQGETEKVMRRAFDVYHGFSALTFDSKRTPDKEPPTLARFGKDAANSFKYIHANDPNGFPGKGFLVSGIEPKKVFASDKDNPDELHKYKSAWKWAENEFDDLPNTHFIFTRGFVAVTCLGDKYKLPSGNENNEDVNYSYVVFNDHQQNYKQDVAYLIPTDVLNEKLKGTTIRLEDLGEATKEYEDINETLPSPQAFMDAAKELGVNVLNIGWGSNYGGSLSNAYPPDSSPYHWWEKEMRAQGETKDFWNHVHKSHMHGGYKNTMATIGDDILVFRKAHQEVYDVTTRYQNLLDLFRISFGLWHKGQTAGEIVKPSGYDPFVDEKLRETEQVASEDIYGEASENQNAHRMLFEAYKWHDAINHGKNNPNDFPVLVMADIFNYWNQPTSPIFLDTYDMTLKIEDATYQLPLDFSEVGDVEITLWQEKVMPHVRDVSKDLRFYHKKDLGLLKEVVS